MPLTRRTLTAALAALLLAAPAATAQPADIHAGLGKSADAANTQDLRSPDTRDTANRYQSPRHGESATAAKIQDRRSPDTRGTANRYQSRTSSLAGTYTQTKPLPGAPARPANPRPIAVAPAAKATDDGNGVDSTTIVLGLAGSLLALGGLAALTHRTRPHRSTT